MKNTHQYSEGETWKIKVVGVHVHFVCLLICDGEIHRHDKHAAVLPLSLAPALAVHLLEVQHSETGGLEEADIYGVCPVGINTLSKIFDSQTTCEEICSALDSWIAKMRCRKIK